VTFGCEIQTRGTTAHQAVLPVRRRN